MRAENGSGTIDAQEMRRVMLNLGEPMKLAEVDEVLKTFDQDGCVQPVGTIPSSPCSLLSVQCCGGDT